MKIRYSSDFTPQHRLITTHFATACQKQYMDANANGISLQDASKSEGVMIACCQFDYGLMFRCSFVCLEISETLLCPGQVQFPLL